MSYGATWKYLLTAEEDPVSYGDASFDDSGWASAPAPFGNDLSPLPDPSWLPWATIIPLTNQLWLRGQLTRVSSVTLRLDASAVQVWWNSAMVYELGAGQTSTLTVELPSPESGVIVIRARRFVRVGPDGYYVDVDRGAALDSPATRQFPRDDALGISAGPRIHPLPKARRLVGGFQ